MTDRLSYSGTTGGCVRLCTSSLHSCRAIPHFTLPYGDCIADHSTWHSPTKLKIALQLHPVSQMMLAYLFFSRTASTEATDNQGALFSSHPQCMMSLPSLNCFKSAVRHPTMSLSYVQLEQIAAQSQRSISREASPAAHSDISRAASLLAHSDISRAPSPAPYSDTTGLLAGHGTQNQSTLIHPRENMSALTWTLVVAGIYLGTILYGPWSSTQ